MNWLAHLFLSEATPAVRIGNLLPDLAPMSSLACLPEQIQRGISQHRRIDAFTDTHPLVRQSKHRIYSSPFKRFGGILIDLFYDHFLARDWRLYSSEPLSEFTQGVYASFDQFHSVIPATAFIRLEEMRAADWLGSYRDMAGITAALDRVGSRLRRREDLGASVSVLQRNYEAFEADFRAFFPELQAYAHRKFYRPVSPNKRSALDARTTPCLYIEGHWPGASESERWASNT